MPSRRNVLKNISAAGLTVAVSGSAATATEPFTVQDRGPTPTDQARSISRLFASGRSLDLPLGVTLITDDWIFRGGEEFAPAENAVISGLGSGSVLRVRRVAHPSFYGLSIKNSGVTFRDMTFEIDVNGGAWCAAVCLAGEASNLRFERVTFRGIGLRTGAYGLTCFFKDFRHISFENCHFENLDFGFVKAIHDPSTQQDFSAVGCTAVRCTEVFELNSPGLFDGNVRAGRPKVSDITTGTEHLRPGMLINSPSLPAGARVTSIDGPSDITVSEEPRTSGRKRFSVGEIRGVLVRDLRVRNMSQWGVGLANVHDFELEVYGEDCDLDLVHIEDHSSNGHATVGGRRCNLKPGQLGSPRSDNAAVLVITGSHDVHIQLDDFDLTQNKSGTPNGVCVHNGVAGTTNIDDICRNISIGGRVLAGPGCIPIIVHQAEVRLANLVVAAPTGVFPETDIKLVTATQVGQISRIAI